MSFKKISSVFIYGVFLTPLFFYPFGVQIFEIPQQAFFMITLGLALLLASLGLFFGKEDFFFEKKLTLLLFLIFLSLLTSALLSLNPIESFYGSFERGQGFITQFFYLLLFVVLVNFLQKRERREVCLSLIIAVGTLLSLFALLQVSGFDVTGINNLAQMSGRAFATLGQPNFLGQFLLTPILGIHCLLLRPSVSKKNKYLLLLPLLLNYVGLVVTQNKASFLGLIIALFVLFFAKKLKKIYLLLAILFITLLSAQLIYSTRSLSSRFFSWSAAVESTMERPFFGHGQETFYLTAQKYLDPKVYWYEDLYTMPDRIHNAFLQTVHDYGFVGLLLLLTSITFLIFSYKKNHNQENIFPFLALLATTISLLFGFSLASNMIILCYVLGLYVVTTLRFKKITVRNLPLKIATFLTSILLCCFTFSHSIQLFSMNAEFSEALKNFLKDPTRSQQEFFDIVEQNPPYRYIHYSALHLLSLHYTPALEQSLTTLGEITNNNFHYFLASARVNHAKNNIDASFIDLEKASELAPNYVLIYQLWGEYALEVGNYDEAAKQFEKFLQIAPPFWRKDHAKDFVSSEQSRIFIKNHPEFVSVLGELMEAYNQTGQKNRAMDLMDSVSPALMPNDY